MRPPPAATAQHLIHMSPPLSSGEPQLSSTSTSSCNPHTCRWRPYSSSNDFEANAAMVLIILFCALICSLALNAAIRCFLRGGGGRPRQFRHNNIPQTQQELEQRKPIPEAAVASMVAAPTLVYTTGLKLAGAEAECAICLSEFVEGEGIQVLAKCKHGFHVQCIQQWLSSHFSCPTCRSSCLSPSPSSEETTHQCVDNSSQTVMPEREREP
ncbi:RING-H2 finger protein ATL79-like [Herrania umbratica]|uniref:RING-type E3 ubiquitin transferase n=1 Tax=Herrania umbratica TaxID=108875 RepID=A0A6J1BGV9_9ROSI|nr:RING-H2 finger protein ATL79-like [Herrania umbratica]